MTFRAWFYRTDPQNIGGQFGTLSGLFLACLLSKSVSQKAQKCSELSSERKEFRAKRFRTIFEKRAPVYSLAAPLLGMAKSIYLAVFAFFLVT